MTVRVLGAASNKRYVSDGGTTVDLAQSATAQDAALAAGMPADEIGTIVRRGTRIPPMGALADGDELLVYPPIMAG